MIVDYIRALWHGNPVRTAAVITAIIIGLTSKFGIVLDEASVTEAVMTMATIILGGEVARTQVTPYVGEIGLPSDATLPPVHQAPAP